MIDLTRFADRFSSMIFAWQPGKEITYVNTAVHTILGYRPEEFNQTPNILKKVLLESDYDKVSAIFDDLIDREDGAAETVIVRCRHTDGSLVWLNISLTKSLDEATNVHQLLGIAQNVTKIQQTAETLREISSVLVSSLELERTLSIILSSLAQLLNFDSAAIYLITPTNRLRMVSGTGMPYIERTIASSEEIDRFPLDEVVISTRLALSIDDVREDKRWTALDGTEYIRSWLGIPLLLQGKPIGLVTVDRSKINPFTLDQIAIAEAFAGHAAIAIQNAELFERIRGLANHLVKAQDEERRRISRELHDEMGQALTALKLNLQMLASSPPAQEALIERLNELVEWTHNSLQEVRRLAMDLRPAMLDDLGLVPTLNWYVNEFKKRGDIEAVLTIDPELPRLSSETETALYRVVQEALTNVSRHSEAEQVEISLLRDKQTLYLSIRDDGKGFIIDIDAHIDSRGVGLLGMLERIENLQGHIDIISKPGQGTHLSIRIPIQVAQNLGK
ncbi:MAG: GAF domain-containing protein [Chloroflexota bacterium]